LRSIAIVVEFLLADPKYTGYIAGSVDEVTVGKQHASDSSMAGIVHIGMRCIRQSDLGEWFQIAIVGVSEGL
jgi:hypothetical protein